MAYRNRSFVEHVAVRVKDIAWHIAFFRDVLGMPLCEVDGDMTSSRKAWSVGGIPTDLRSRLLRSGRALRSSRRDDRGS